MKTNPLLAGKRSARQPEYRTFALSEVRAEDVDGKQYLVGYAARYNIISHDLGWGMFERIQPGAFKRAIVEKHDVMHLVNHDPSQILGRTMSGTTELSEDSKGLAFRTLVNNEDPAAVAFAARVKRGDIDQCSFAFSVVTDDNGRAVGAEWTEVPDPNDSTQTILLREVKDVILYDVSTVTYPAYPQTNTALAAIRSDGARVPMKFRAHVRGLAEQAAARDYGDDVCGCDCMACYDAECEDCMDENCVDPGCRCWMRSRRDSKKTKKVDGEDLGSECFIIVGDAGDPSTWKLPWKFSDEEKTKSHLRNALARFNQMKGLSDDEKSAAWSKLVGLCKEHGIKVDDDENKSIRERLTSEQVAELNRDEAAELAAATLRAAEEEAARAATEQTEATRLADLAAIEQRKRRARLLEIESSL